MGLMWATTGACASQEQGAPAAELPGSLRQGQGEVSQAAAASASSLDTAEEAGAASAAAVIAAGEAAADPPPPVATPGPDAPPSVSALRPWFSEPPLSEGLGDYLDGRNAAAAKAFGAFVAAHPDDPRARPAHLMALLSRHDAGEHTPVAAELEAVAEAWPLLSDYALYYAGSAHHQARRFDEAVARLAEVPRGSTLWPRAQELLARAHVGAGRRDEAIAILDAAAASGRELRSSAWALLVEQKAAAGDRRGVKEARLELAIRYAALPAGRAAYRALGRRPRLTPDERYRLGRALYNAQRHAAAVAVLSKIGRRDPRYCEARYLQARTYDKLKRRDDAWEQYQQALKCKGKVRADATFAGGRSRLRAGDDVEAQRLLTAHVEEFPDRTTFDDARLDLAGILRERGEAEAADALLLKTLEAHPDGDQRDEIAWRLVWPRIEAGEVEGALALADQALALVPRETHYRAEGRLRYWRGVLLARSKRAEEAAAEWRRVLEEHPLSWYGLLAYARLHAVDAAAARAFVDGLVARTEAPPDPLAVIPAELWRDPHLRKGVELARMGLADSARRELRAAPRPRGEARRAWLWTQVALYQLSGGWHFGQRLARSQEPEFGRFWPAGPHAAVWRMAHPRPFAGLVEAWAGERGIDPYWVWSIMREESNFNPRVESWANAVGLMQIILPTAEFLSRGTDIEPTRVNLKKPAVAIELGTKYLARLLDDHGSFPLASAGYNAGGGAVKRWRRRFGDVELDEFVERISYKEARGYAKRVTRSIGRYTWLYEGEMLLVPLAAPGAP
ncbi:MAG: hypothetical protein CSA66_06665 [Proteobacteria bacterium]|nr:MAG: hypothetical protein CSA66_06665 [Pseudomonadota bacterium]